MQKITLVCAALASVAVVIVSVPAEAQSKMTREQAAAACRQELGTGSLAGAGQRDLKICIRAKMGAGGKQKR